jgi:hypothetical protein
MKTSFGRILFPTVFLGLALANPAVADIAEVISGDGKRMTFEYQDDNLRINMANDDGYMIIHGENVYAVDEADGEVMVIDVKQTLSMFGNMAQAAIPDMAAVRVKSLEPTGRTESVAGIVGDVYRLAYTDHEGKSQEADIVLSPDRRAVGFRDAVHRMSSTMSSMLAQQGTHDRLRDELAMKNLGVLRYGDDMRLTSITEGRVDDSRFVLPAEPTDLTGMGGLWGAGLFGDSDGSSGGFMSGILGGDSGGNQGDSGKPDKAESTSNPVEDATKEIGKAFGKLFGN